MKKLITIFGILVLASTAMFAQDCQFKVRFRTIDATCYNNGKVVYALLDASNNVITSLPANLSDVRIYYKASANEDPHYNNTYYTGGWDTLTIDYGTYTVGVEAACSTGGNYTKLDTNTTLTINTSYKKPSVSVINNTAKTVMEFGKRPTLDCANTGRVQLKIEYGSFPYIITVKQHGSDDTVRTLVFNQRQYFGYGNSSSNPNYYNYYYYYTVDNLPAGDWDFYVVDGCGYGLPRTGQTVETVSFPKLDKVEVYASSGNFEDENVVKVNAVMEDYAYYYLSMLPTYAQYRFTNTGFGSTEWKTFPAITSGNKATLYDTVAGASKYCDIWNKNLTLEYKITGCGSETTSKTFQIYKPNDTYFDKDSVYVNDSIIGDDRCTSTYYSHTESYKIRYYSTAFNQGLYAPNYFTVDGDHTYYRYHYTHPIKWVYTDKNTNNVIKEETVPTIISQSTLTGSEVEAIYGSFRNTPITLNVERKLVDANGCVLYTTTDNLVYKYTATTPSCTCKWYMRYSTFEDHCCNSPRSVWVYCDNETQVDLDGTIVKLVTSPYNNRYNFEAVYSSATRSWTVTKSNIENVAIVGGTPNGLQVSLNDYCLPSGPYRFQIISPCGGTTNLSANIGFADVYTTEITEEPVFSEQQQCTDHYITYSAGRFSRVARNQSPTTGLDLTPVTQNLPTYFQIISGPTGGYDLSARYTVNQPMRISMPGTYIVKISPETNLVLCDQPYYYDTIVYGGPTVEFDYEIALLCDETSTSGNVYVKGTNGTEPYTYTLYSQPDKQGTVLATNSTGVFSNIAMTTTSTLSCLVKDACDAYFHVNIIPRTLQDMQKIWFDGGMTVAEACEGSTIQVHALEIGSILQYTWSGPNGFIGSGPEPYIFVPRNATEGWYKVRITNTGCSGAIMDSVMLTVKESPKLTIKQDTTVCPGEEIEVKFTPTSSNYSHVYFTVAFENADGIETRTYSANSGSTITDVYRTISDAKIYPISIKDNTCEYTLADAADTIYITMRTNVIDACKILTTYDTVCYTGTAYLYAKSTVTPPYTIRWYRDYELTQLIKEEEMTNSNDWSNLTEYYVTQRVYRYVSIEKEGQCPSVPGLVTNTINMSNGNTTIACGRSYRLYDSGGADGDYATGEMLKHTFKTTDGKPVTIKFDELNLSNTAHIFVITGNSTNTDSVLYDITANSANPGVISSNGGALTLYFMSGMQAGGGWSAIVEHSPGIAIADPYKKNEITLRDEVCQSQTNTYSDPLGVTPNIVSLDELNNAMRQAGTYTFTKTLSRADQRGCDSTVNFVFNVTAPPHYDTTVVITNMHNNPYTWRGNTYTTSGQYAHVMSLPGGCDSLAILNLIVLQIDTTTNEVCLGDSITMGITVSEPEITWKDNILPNTVNIGDVLCDDGTIMNPDSFLTSGKIAKGVVFYVDETGIHGKAVSLINLSSSLWCSVGTDELVSSVTCSNDYYNEAMFDMNGLANTEEIKRTAELLGDFAFNAPAAHACYYYDHITKTIGDVHKGWYLPSLGELLILGTCVDYVGDVMLKLGIDYSGYYLGGYHYWTSTESFTPSSATYDHPQAKRYAWSVYLGANAYQSAKNNTNNYSYLRAICAF